MPDQDGDDDNGSQRWTSGRIIPSQPNPYFTQLAEQRLNDLNRQSRELRQELANLRDKQATSEATSKENGWGIKRLEEMMQDFGRQLTRIEQSVPDKRRAELVEKVVFGLVGLILVAVVGLWLKTIGIGK